MQLLVFAIGMIGAIGFAIIEAYARAKAGAR